MRLYDSNIPSGNSYKVHLLLHQLGMVYDTVDLDILSTPSQTREPAFLAKNPNGRIPLLELDDGTLLPESNAILYYLAEDTTFWPRTRIDRARTLEWMFFEQYSHEPYVAVFKFVFYWHGIDNVSAETLERLRTRGQAALDVMDTHLRTRDFFVGDCYGIADIALFAYTQSAEAVGFRVSQRVNAWLERVRQQPGHVAIKNDPTGRCPPA